LQLTGKILLKFDFSRRAMYYWSADVLSRDLLHLLENTFDRKRISANPSPKSSPNPNAQ